MIRTRGIENALMITALDTVPVFLSSRSDQRYHCCILLLCFFPWLGQNACECQVTCVLSACFQNACEAFGSAWFSLELVNASGGLGWEERGGFGPTNFAANLPTWRKTQPGDFEGSREHIEKGHFSGRMAGAGLGRQQRLTQQHSGQLLCGVAPPDPFLPFMSRGTTLLSC